MNRIVEMLIWRGEIAVRIVLAVVLNDQLTDLTDLLMEMTEIRLALEVMKRDWIEMAILEVKRVEMVLC